jgi:hypothetical protein
MSADHRQYQGSEREHQTAALFSDKPKVAVLIVGGPLQPEPVHDCARCGSLVLDRDQHTRWHSKLDSSATAEVGR